MEADSAMMEVNAEKKTNAKKLLELADTLKQGIVFLSMGLR